MPSVLEDPTSPPTPRVSPSSIAPTPIAPFDAAPLGIKPHRLTLRDGSPATLLPVTGGASSIPAPLLEHLRGLLNAEIEGGDTYPMTATMGSVDFGRYWTGNFAGVLLQGHFDVDAEERRGGTADGQGAGQGGAVERVLAALQARGVDWSSVALGTFYVKPNYPGRSSHVCNAGFLVGPAARGKGVGRLMGEAYLDWAPRLGYVYSIFNLVYETNTASLRIWDALGFQRVGRVKGAGNLASFPDRLVDAIVYGRDLRVGEELSFYREAVESVEGHGATKT